MALWLEGKNFEPEARKPGFMSQVCASLPVRPGQVGLQPHSTLAAPTCHKDTLNYALKECVPAYSSSQIKTLSQSLSYCQSG